MHPRLLPRLALVLAVILAVAACRTTAEPRDTTPAKPKPPRPTEDPEGVPGYLTDPELISARRTGEGDATQLVAKPGAVVVAAGKPLRIRVWQVEPKDLLGATPGGGASGALDVMATKLVEVDAATDGSFAAQVTAAAGNQVVVDSGVALSPRGFVVEAFVRARVRLAIVAPRADDTASRFLVARNGAAIEVDAAGNEATPEAIDPRATSALHELDLAAAAADAVVPALVAAQGEAAAAKLREQRGSLDTIRANTKRLRPGDWSAPSVGSTNLAGLVRASISTRLAALHIEQLQLKTATPPFTDPRLDEWVTHLEAAKNALGG
jgi:hypothetical protein